MNVKLSGITKNGGKVCFELDDLIELNVIANTKELGGLFRINTNGHLIFRCGYSNATKRFDFMCNGHSIQTGEESDG